MNELRFAFRQLLKNPGFASIAVATLALGVAGNMFGALLATPVTRHLPYGVSPFEPFTLAAVTLGLLLVAVLACWIPARRAMRVDPVEALRSE